MPELLGKWVRFNCVSALHCLRLSEGSVHLPSRVHLQGVNQVRVRSAAECRFETHLLGAGAFERN